MESQALIAWIGVGLAVGLIGSFAVGGGLIRNLIAGMLGALIAGWAATALTIHLGIGDFWIRQVVIAGIGAAIVVLAGRTLT